MNIILLRYSLEILYSWQNRLKWLINWLDYKLTNIR
jgi:hypothetical protein